jgi:hypothetical protein
MSRSTAQESRKKGKRAKKSAVKFRTGVPKELVDRLLKTFVQTVWIGLDLILSQPSERARQVLKEHPLWVISPELDLVQLSVNSFLVSFRVFRQCRTSEWVWHSGCSNQ